jgi:hypothetical protein
MNEITVYDCATGETITREMTDAELSNLENVQTGASQEKAEAEAKAAQKAALLERLGITEDEERLLLG